MDSSESVDGFADDIFDELECMSFCDREIRNLSTDMVLAAYRHMLSCHQASSNDGSATKEPENEPAVEDISGGDNGGESHVSENCDLDGAMTCPSGVVTIYQIMSDSFRNRFSSRYSPKYKELLEKLKCIPVSKVGVNKKTGENETYTWRSPGSCLTYEEGGKIGNLRDDRSGRQSNWHFPFFGALVQERTPDKKEYRRVACLLCDHLETMHNVRHNLIRHMTSRHSDYTAVFSIAARRPSEAVVKESLSEIHWKIVIKHAQYVYYSDMPILYNRVVRLCFVEFIPFKVACSEAFTVYAKTLNPGFIPYDVRRLRHALLYNMYAPSLHHMSEVLQKQLLCLPNSFVLTLDCWSKSDVGSVYGCSLSFIDDDFVLHSYVLGLTPLAQGIEIVPYAIAKIMSSVGPITLADCCVMVSRDTAEAQSIAASLGLTLVGLSVDDVLQLLRAANSISHDNDQEKYLDVPTAIARAHALVDYFSTSDKAIDALYMCSGPSDNINLLAFDSSDHSSLSPCIVSILNASVAIKTYFETEHFLTSPDARMVLVPTKEDWKFWGELVAVLDPVRTVIEMLKGKNDPGISLLWYVLDWLVCIHEQTTEWDVYSTEDGEKHHVSIVRMCRGIKDWVTNFTALVRSEFLSMKLKSVNKAKYEMMCKATYIDPRTKNFKFFRSEAYQVATSKGGSHSGFPEVYKSDAKTLVLMDMREELCALIQDLFLGNLHPEDRIYALVFNIVSSAGIVVSVPTVPYVGPQRQTARASYNFGGKRKWNDWEGREKEVEAQSPPSDTDSAQQGSKIASPASTSSPVQVTELLSSKIDLYCRYEMKLYEEEDMICMPHQIRQHDALLYWTQNTFKFPILSQLSHRLLCLRNISVSDRICSASSRLHRRQRHFDSLALADAITFLHLNGVIASSPPPDVVI